LGIDACISPRQATAAAILKDVRRGEVLGVAMVEQCDSEVIELLLTKECSILHRPLKDLHVPGGCIIGAIVRHDGVIIPDGDDLLAEGDHVILFSLPDAVSRAEEFFT
jgi:trk system potassium uptake protein TrkA